MGAGYKRKELQAISEAKLQDAILLLEHRRLSNAYYLAGYAVEIGLKACIAAQITAETIPDKNFIGKVFSHKALDLIGSAGLLTELKNQQKSDQNFSTNWGIVTRWSPETRYETKDVTSTQTMIEAVANKDSGVLQWIRTHW